MPLYMSTHTRTNLGNNTHTIIYDLAVLYNSKNDTEFQIEILKYYKYYESELLL